jgi:hypothetical protein
VGAHSRAQTNLDGGSPEWLLGFPVVQLPFEEGLPSKEKAARMRSWLSANSDLYLQRYTVLYHGTDPRLPILKEGLKPTTPTRRRSFQSSSGFVYLAATPERAEQFGRLGNQGRCTVYQVAVLVRHLLADLDQIRNQQSVGLAVGTSLADSIVYTGCARVRGSIPPYQVRQYQPPASE